MILTPTQSLALSHLELCQCFSVSASQQGGFFSFFLLCQVLPCSLRRPDQKFFEIQLMAENQSLSSGEQLSCIMTSNHWGFIHKIHVYFEWFFLDNFWKGASLKRLGFFTETVILRVSDLPFFKLQSWEILFVTYSTVKGQSVADILQERSVNVTKNCSDRFQ